LGAVGIGGLDSGEQIDDVSARVQASLLEPVRTDGGDGGANVLTVLNTVLSGEMTSASGWIESLASDRCSGLGLATSADSASACAV